jgi:hypothetical protein
MVWRAVLMRFYARRSVLSIVFFGLLAQLLLPTKKLAILLLARYGCGHGPVEWFDVMDWREASTGRTVMAAWIIWGTTSVFADMRSANAVSVGKTRLVYKWMHDDWALFLARPRRFDKSLLLAYLWKRRDLFVRALGSGGYLPINMITESL